MERDTTNAMHESLDVFDDEFAVDDFDLVADGFAPGRFGTHTHAADQLDEDASEDDDPPVRTLAAHMADLPPAATPTSSRFAANRSSIRKSSNMDNPFSSAEDGDDQDSLSGRPLSIRSQSTAYAPGDYHRSLSETSSRAFAPSRSPAQAASGPSHPYAMYPQGTVLARSPSVSTVSTIRAPQRPLMADQGPAHPYGMYPQNVSEDDDGEQETDPGTSSLQAQIPVGFPGRAQPAYRRQGPEGEEHDIIGLDGHAEQLPAYSEYPEDGVPKHIVLPEAAAAAATTGPSLALPFPAERAPQSMSDAGARAADSQDAFVGMQQMESNDSSLSTPKRWRDKSWKEKRKTKFCGIPFWWLLLSLCVLAFVAAVLGGAIGGFMTTQKHAQHNHAQAHQPTSTTNLYDASPISSSTGTPPATGTYALSLGTAEATYAACLSNQSFAAAWSCNISGPESLAISVEDLSSSSAGSEGASLFDTSDYDNFTDFTYGTQPPSTSLSQFTSVTDDDDPALGPAYYFQAYFNKLVIVEESAFASSVTNDKREAGWYINPAWTSRKQIAAGERPWFCFWNGTLLEGFIYNNNYTSNTTTTSAPSSSAYLATATHSPYSATATYSPSSSPSLSSSYITTTVSGASTTATLTAASASSATSASTFTSTNAQSSGVVDYDSLPTFGYLVKIEERRVQDSVAPYCQQMQILDDGSAGAVSDASGNLVTITLAESDPSYTSYASATAVSGSVASGCHCQWWSGAN